MSVKLSKKTETVYVARCQWAVGTDAEGNDVTGFGLLWERKSSAEATNIAVVHGAETYVPKWDDAPRRYHTWVERVTRMSATARRTRTARPSVRGAARTCTVSVTP